MPATATTRRRKRPASRVRRLARVSVCGLSRHGLQGEPQPLLDCPCLANGLQPLVVGVTIPLEAGTEIQQRSGQPLLLEKVQGDEVVPGDHCRPEAGEWSRAGSAIAQIGKGEATAAADRGCTSPTRRVRPQRLARAGARRQRRAGSVGQCPSWAADPVHRAAGCRSSWCG